MRFRPKAPPLRRALKTKVPALGATGKSTSEPPRWTYQPFSSFQPDVAAHCSMVGAVVLAVVTPMGRRFKLTLLALPAPTVMTWLSVACAGAVAVKVYW